MDIKRKIKHKIAETSKQPTPQSAPEISENQNIPDLKIPDLETFLSLPTSVLSEQKQRLFLELWGDQDAQPEAGRSIDVKTQFSLENNASDNEAEINFLNSKNRWHARIAAWRARHVAQHIAIFSVTVIFVALLFRTAGIFAETINSKAQVLGATTEGLAHLSAAEALVAQKNFTDSDAQFKLAQQNFIQGKIDLGLNNPLLASVVNLIPKGRDAENILNAGENLSQAGKSLSDFYAIASQIKAGAQGFNAPDGFYESLNVARNYLNSGDNYLKTASADFDLVNPANLPSDFQQKFSAYSEQIHNYSASIEEANQLLGLLQSFIGSGQKSILVLFENNNELRPGGGFIGTYGFFKFDDGKIVSQKISSIYDLDGQLKDKIAPPGEFHDLTDHWGLRDSNWFVDFKQSALKASVFYEKEGGETPDAVVALTPDVFVDLLKATGPIYFDKYGTTLSADNFRNVVQENTSDQQSKTPKQFLADFAPLFLQNLTKSDGSRAGVLSALLQNIAAKNIIFYDRNADVQQQFESYNWAGRIADTDKDYLAIYNANLGGQKTDLNVSQSAKLQSEVQSDGSIINTLTYTRTHAPVYTDPQNISYIRFVVPSGSELISAGGFDPKPFYRSDGSDYTFEADANFKTDPDLMALDYNSRIDASSGTVISSEAGKTTFGNWITLSQGQSKTVFLKYKLPFNVNDDQKYSLTVQKQPGTLPYDFEYDLDAGRNYLWYSRYDLDINNNQLIWKSSISNDSFLGLLFK